MCCHKIQQRRGGRAVSTLVEVRRLTTPQDLFQAAADEVLRAATHAVAERGRFTIALSGGSTPKNLYTLIAANADAALPWDRMFFFFGDERHVPPDDPESNYRMAKETLSVEGSSSSRQCLSCPCGESGRRCRSGGLRADSAKIFRVGSRRISPLRSDPAGHWPGWTHRVLVSGNCGVAGENAAGGSQLGGKAEYQPDYFDPARAEPRPLCCLPGERNR